MTRDFDQLPLSGWYPGHMLKAGRAMQERLKLVDLVVEVLDARIPAASRNPRFRHMLGGKPVALVLNKADLADPTLSNGWRDWFVRAGDTVFVLDSTRAKDTGRMASLWKRQVDAERAARGATQPLRRPVRVMIAGIPNVGKSTMVNALAGGRRAIVGPKPGVTRQTQWIPLQAGIDLLDTPGVLWPRIESKTHELKLAIVGTIKDEVLSGDLLAEFIWTMLHAQVQREKVSWEGYGLTECPDAPDKLLAAVARRRGLVRPGGDADFERAANVVINDFRAGRLGRFTLETPPEE